MNMEHWRSSMPSSARFAAVSTGWSSSIADTRRIATSRWRRWRRSPASFPRLASLFQLERAFVDTIFRDGGGGNRDPDRLRQRQLSEQRREQCVVALDLNRRRRRCRFDDQHELDRKSTRLNSSHLGISY